MWISGKSIWERGPQVQRPWGGNVPGMCEEQQGDQGHGVEGWG